MTPRSQRLAPVLFLAPLLALMGLFVLYPLADSFWMSFHTSLGPRRLIFVGLANYRFLIFHDKLFWLATLNTFAYAIGLIAIELPLSLGLALLLNSPKVRARGLLRLCFFSTHLVGQVFVATIFFELFDARGGLINLGIGALIRQRVQIAWLSDPNLTLLAIILAGLWLSVGLGMLYFLAALQTIEPMLYEAARVDGAAGLDRFLHITLPGIWPVTIFLILLGAIGAFQLFELPYVLLQGPGPGYRGLTLVMYLFSEGFSRGDLGYASAIGWLLAAMLTLILIFFSRLAPGSDGGDL